MRKPVLILAAVVLVFGACSSKHESKRGQNAGRTTRKAGVGPSSVTAMICGTEAKREIAQSDLGLDTIESLRPTWNETRHVYSCDYVDPGGAKMTLSVRETSSANATSAYFDLLTRHLGKKRPLFGFTNAAAFVTSGDSIVLRKDDKVLLVDVSKLPLRFRRAPGNTRYDVAVGVAAIIVGCWGGSGLVR